MSNFMINPNADIYQLLQQNQGGGGGSGGGGGGGFELDMGENMQQARANLFEAGGMGDIAFNQGLRQRMTDYAMRPMEAKQMQEINQQMFLQSLQQQKQMFLELQQLQLQLASASGPEAEALETQLNQKEDELRKLSRAMEMGKASMASKSTEAQNELLNAQSGTKTMLTAQMNRLQALRGPDGAGIETSLDSSLSRLLSSPAAFGARDPSMLNAAGAAVSGMLEGFGELFTGDRVANQELTSAALRPEMYAAARSFGGGALRTMLPEGTGLPGIFGMGPQDTSVVDEAAKANGFASEVLSTLAIDALSGTPTGVRDRGAADSSLRRLFTELASSASVSGADPKDVTSRVLPILQDAAEAIYGDRNASANLADDLDEILKTASVKSSKYAEGLSEAAKDRMGVEQVQKAAMAFALDRSRNLRSVLNAATTGQMFRVADLQRLSGVFSEELKPGGAFQLPAILRALQAQGIDPMLSLLPSNISGSIGRARGIESDLQKLLTEEAVQTRQQGNIEEELAQLERPSSARMARTRQAQLDAVQRMLANLNKR